MTLTQFSEDGSLEAINCFLRLVRPNCLVSSYIVPSEPGLESFSKESNEVGLLPHPEFPPTDTGSLI